MPRRKKRKLDGSDFNPDPQPSHSGPQKERKVSPGGKQGKLVDSNAPECPTFTNMGLKEKLLFNLQRFNRPSLVQRRAIGQILSGFNVLAQAQPSTGKSTMAAICALQTVESVKDCQVLVIHPTVDLAIKFTSLVESIGESMDITTRACVGGEDIAVTTGELEGAQIVSGTPGRMNDMINKRILRTRSIKLVILDSADLMDQGTMDQILEIKRFVPPFVGFTLLFTMLSDSIINSVQRIAKEPVCILVNRDEMIGKVSQFYLEVEKEDWKFDCLMDAIDSLQKEPTIIFCNTRRKIDWLLEKLGKRANLRVTHLDAQMSIAALKQNRSAFEDGKAQILLSTDGCAHAIDPSKVRAVINYDLPSNRENYLLRIGKAGERGTVLNFVKKEDIRTKNDLEVFFATEIRCLPGVYGYQDLFGNK
eukprot:Phypoly_transcript_08384.p1 GENE.Phypoly_transcript_08384~~Phypoly_transcript_08384.p1  ORF type:complete len:420 (+),score=47.27 Phypoly_transcript_08384:215-1474(+)